MLNRLDRSPAYVALFLVLLAGVQARSLALQFMRGFRPFAHEPTRVAFSWDMFATRVERCTLEWNPPLAEAAGGISGFRDLATALEWDVVFDTADNYRWAAGWGCRTSSGARTTRLHCFFPDGTETKDEYACP